ncbi:MAG: GAF domain-containing sensor histidine kinase [Chloroflexi bacterium]|nr:GAF domain-containing sensor histidine kinase [Chloroflexota bacterium]
MGVKDLKRAATRGAPEAVVGDPVAELERLNAQLQAEQAQWKTAEERLRREANRAEALVRVAGLLNAQLDLQTVLDAVCEETAHALFAPAVSLGLYDAERDVVNETAAYGLPRAYLRENQAIPAAAYGDTLKRHGAVSVIADLQAVTGARNAGLIRELNLRTILTMGMLREDERIGVINVIAPGEPRAFTDMEMMLLQGIAHQAAQAIVNARLFEQVRAARESLQDLSRRMEEAQTLERRALARELHDKVGLNLTVLSINLNLIRSQLPPDAPPSVGARLNDSLNLLQETIERTRDVMTELRPPVLDDYGLASALRWYAAQFSERTGIRAVAQAEELEPRPPVSVEAGLFRITQEALHNVTKHAQATQVKIELECLDTAIRLSIADDGVGFDTQAAVQPGERRGLGLVSMRERAEALEARLRVHSVPGHGTTVTVEVSR